PDRDPSLLRRTLTQVACFYSAAVAWNCSAVDIMTAEEDLGNSPEMSKAIASAISAPQPIILPGLRHMAMIEAPDVFNRPLLDFLQSCLDSNHHQHLADATIRL
ncbi:pimeloyl-ACP methyl ester carboxylesterase, partial [Rhodoligotrophos appendicifer]|uniref:alpha/beta fold hydrolase n=2 Tax=Rhodoligotrophos appendicifer TaxID=987056 RepID=UPI003D254547